MTLGPKETKARVLLHRRIAADYFRLRLLCPEVARQARPGQFAMLRVNELRDPFLRRPFSFSQIHPPGEKKKNPLAEGSVEICYQVVGRGTSLMSQLSQGDRLDLLGPLGNGFWQMEGRQTSILIGGGIGAAPLLAWAQELRGTRSLKSRSLRNPDERRLEVLFLIGGKTRDHILGASECRKIGIESLVATEDGSLGMRGMATDLLERELLSGRYDSPVVYACGPPAMLSRVAQMADQFDVPCQVLLESRMACGVGACLGCTVKVREYDLSESQGPESVNNPERIPSLCEEESGREMTNKGFMPVISETPSLRYARACKEGPVFDSRKIFWE